MRRLAILGAIVVTATTGMAATAGAAAPRAADPQLLERFRAQADPLAAPAFGSEWQGFAKRYALSKRRLVWVQGRRIGDLGCATRLSLTLKRDEDVIEGRERALHVPTCLSLVEIGVPPRSALDEPQQEGMSTRGDSAAMAAVPPAEPDPAGEVTDPSDAPKNADPDDALPAGNHDVVDQQPGAEAEADPGEMPWEAVKDLICEHDPGLPACGGCPPICDEAEGTRVLTRHTAGTYRSWYEDPAPFNIDVAGIKDAVDFRYGGGCAGWGTFYWGWWADWYSTTGWQFDDFNHHFGRVCGYVYHSSYAHFRNPVFCRVLAGPLFGKTTKIKFDRNTIRGLGNGGLKGIVNARRSGGCFRLLSLNDRLRREWWR